MIGSKLAHYEITSHLGSGGMGEVYQAIDSKLGRSVAIKLLPEAFTHDYDRAARFEREARVLASLNHPNIAAIYGIEESGGRKFLVMELVGGETLAQKTKRGAVRFDEALRIAKEIAQGLEAAHEKGIIHRDLKPANVKIAPDGKVKILDFGLAKAFESDAANVNSSNSPTISASTTNAGVILGTAAYMSPEQALGKPVDKRADIWAFGVVLYEMLAGRRLFKGETTAELIAAVLKEEPDFSRVPAKARAVLRSCLQKDPRQRLHDIADAMPLADTIQDATPVHASRPWLAWTLSGMFFLIAATLGFIHFRETPRASDPGLFYIPVPDGLTFIAGTHPSLSPNGRSIAFAAKGTDGKTHMYVRPRDLSEVKELPETEVTGNSPPPFWSFDSRSIVFAGGGWLKMADISGAAPPQLLCELGQSAQGISMNRSGVIVFSGSRTALRRVSTNRSSTPVTILGPGETAHRWPQFLPDNRHFLYHRLSSAIEKTGIYVGDIDAKPEDQDTTVRLQTDRQAYYMPASDGGAGWLVFMRESTLLAQPFDPQSWKFNGEETTIARSVFSIPTANAGLFSISATGDLAYRTGASLRQLTWRDSRGEVAGVLGDLGHYYNLTLSPDGKRVAMQEIGPGGRQDIVVMDDRGVKTPLIHDAHRNDFPVWDPTGTKVAFASNRRSNQMDLYEYDLNTGHERILLESPQDKTPTSWSSDGKFLMFTSRLPKKSEDLAVLRLSDRMAFPFATEDYDEYAGAFSRGVDAVAYTSRESGFSEIYVKRFSVVNGIPSSTGRIISVSKGGGDQARWRADDGKKLFYLNLADQLFSADVNGIEISPGERLFDTHTDTGNSDLWGVTQDGKRFLFHALPPPNTNTPLPFTILLNLRERLKKPQ